LNASVTLGGNRTLSFSSTPAAGSYGTLVITQDATGGRNITLPSTANKILGSTSTTTIALSTAGGAKDILNFYYDGTNCFWSIGQGYGLASSSLSINLATGVTGTLSIANGGTGATTSTGTGSVVLSASPTFTGTPAAPTATSGDNSTQIATTAFVTTAVAAGGGGSTYTIGSNPSLGGYVFYVTPDGKHGLVAETYEFDAQLYLGFDYIKDPAYHSTNGKNFTDWRIPSLYELRLMNAIRTTLSMNQSYYWSSSFGSNTWAYKTRRFGDGGEYEQGSDVTHTIRAIRTF